MRALVLLTLPLYFQSTFCGYNFYIYKVVCSNGNESDYLRNTVCRTGRNSTISLYGDLVLPFDYAKIDFKLFFIPTNNTILNYNFEFCKAYGSFPIYVRSLLDVVKQCSKDFIHNCPYKPTKHIGMENCPMEPLSSVLQFLNFQIGDYNTVFDVRDKFGKIILYLKFYTALRKSKVNRKKKKG